MPRGSRPGERRGGRKLGTPNKKTLIKNAVFLAAASDRDRSPLDFMLALMRDPQVSLDLRIRMAASTAPLVHARPRASDRSRPHPMELRAQRAKAAIRTGAESAPAGGEVKSASLGVTEKPVLGDGGEKQVLAGGGKAAARLPPVAPAAAGNADSTRLDPLDFLLGVMHDPEAAPRHRVRAAQIAARYKERPPHRFSYLVEDEFGFQIDPLAAKAVRDIRRGPSSSDAQTEDGLVREHLQAIDCPDAYGGRDLEKDEGRLRELREHRRKAKLTPFEDDEETYLTARTEVYRTTPKHRAWCRLSKLEVRLAGWEPLTAAEQHELDDLRARFPSVARDLADTDWTKEMEIMIPMHLAMEKYREFKRRGLPLDKKEITKAVIVDLRREEAEHPGAYAARQRAARLELEEGFKEYLKTQK
jgi:hypothetical protein